MSKIPPDNENFQTIRLLHHSLVFPLKNPFPPINQTAKVCFATIVSRPLNNPFAFVFDGREQSGIYSAFEVGGGDQTMWSVAGARAGYRLSEWAEGEYRNRGSIQKKFNLCVTDWDAMFLPLREESTVSSGFLSGMAKELGVSNLFVRKDHLGSYSRLDFSAAKEHLYH